ncbi:GroES-like protein [Cryphonectria parasitica EP155]|uniref:GroES-like protein n=1 Tax=Cryphonectria parasitica (strain ATCC 38755 / EP155) TaxID=660469 RepID=A0A9P4XSS8_CRYP1|nr:GroES-like protein [Cryphonectria parasitica EP155]KAF3760537.1 GroES-like protein [Cryphonectria parasitica EP155]
MSSPGTQTALLLTEIGKPLVKSTIPVEEVEEGRVLVKNTATGLIPADYKLRDNGLGGMAEHLPIIVGCEIAGRVVTDTADLPAGTRVVYQPQFKLKLSGGLQEYAVARPDLVFRIPDHMLDEEAANLGTNPFTAAVALFDPVFGFGIPLPNSPEAKTYDFASTKVVIIGGTAVARFAVQQAHLAGIGTIIAIASPKTNADLASYGATLVIDRHLDPDEIAAQVRAAAGDDLRFVFDTYSTEDPALARSFFHKPGGFLVMASSRGPRDQVALTAKGIIVKGFRAWLEGFPELNTAWVALFNGWLADGKIKIPPFQVVPFEADAVNAALDNLKKAESGVKYVVKIASS